MCHKIALARVEVEHESFALLGEKLIVKLELVNEEKTEGVTFKLDIICRDPISGECLKEMRSDVAFGMPVSYVVIDESRYQRYIDD